MFGREPFSKTYFARIWNIDREKITSRIERRMKTKHRKRHQGTDPIWTENDDARGPPPTATSNVDERFLLRPFSFTFLLIWKIRSYFRKNSEKDPNGEYAYKVRRRCKFVTGTNLLVQMQNVQAPPASSVPKSRHRKPYRTWARERGGRSRKSKGKGEKVQNEENRTRLYGRCVLNFVERSWRRTFRGGNWAIAQRTKTL